MFPWHTLATISPTACVPAYLSFSFWLPLLSLSCSLFLFSYFSATLPISLLFLLPKVFEFLLSSRHDVIFFWVPQKLTYIQVQVDVNSSAPPSLKHSLMCSTSISSNSSAMLCLWFFLNSLHYYTDHTDKQCS